jgi:hypothetical protein
VSSGSFILHACSVMSLHKVPRSVTASLLAMRSMAPVGKIDA